MPPPAVIPPPEKDKTEILIWGVPANLKRRFKMRCARDRISMREQLIQLIENHLAGRTL